MNEAASSDLGRGLLIACCAAILFTLITLYRLHKAEDEVSAFRARRAALVATALVIATLVGAVAVGW